MGWREAAMIVQQSQEAMMRGGNRWCPTCGAEYLPGVDTCGDCRVALQDEPPAPPDHETITYDLEDWDDDLRRALELLLRGADVSFGWEADSDLIVSCSMEAIVDELIEDLEQRPMAASETAPPRPRSPGDVQPGERLATIGQRALARLIDGVLTVVPGALVFVATGQLTFDANQPRLPLWLRFLGLVLPFAYEVTLVALWGQTLGKRIVGIRVIGPDGQPPGWGRSLRRWLVPFALGMMPFIGWLLGMAAFLRAAIVDDRRGFHDLAAGTAVLQDPPP
jgi:uncharacterized RDD family membrane protein YckC